MRLPARAHCVVQVVLIVMSATSVRAQEQDRCRDILIQSVNDLSLDRLNYQQRVATWMCDQRGSALGLANPLEGALIRGIPAQFGGDLDGDSATSWFDNHCGASPQSLPVKRADAVVARLAPVPSAEHWLACIVHSAYDWQIRIRRAHGFEESAIKLAAVLDGSSVQLTATWKPPSSGDDPPKVTNFIVFGADCPISGSGFAAGAPLHHKSTITCQRREDSPMAFILGTSHAPAALHFPSVEPPPAGSARITSVAMPEGSMDGGTPLEDQQWSDEPSAVVVAWV